MAVVTKDKSGSDKSVSEKQPDKVSKSSNQSVDLPAENKLSVERTKALGLALDSIKKQYGDGSIMRLGDSRHGQIEAIPTGALALDVALGVGGLPRGRIIEIYGPESSGKTTLAQHVAAEVQKLGGIAAIVDAEHAMDPEYSRVYQISREAFQKYIRENPNFGLRLIEIIGGRLKQAQSRIEDLVFRQVPSRVARLLISLAENHGKVTPRGIRVEFPLTHQEIADLVGSSRVTVTQILNRFRSSHWIAIESKRVTIHDMTALEDMVRQV